MAGHRVTPAGHDTAADSSAEVISELRRRIREHWEGFSPAARSVCRALSERSAEQLVFVSAAELGAETKTSNATVVRTVQALGYSGLAELKAKLAAPIAGNSRLEQRTRRRVESTGGDLEEVWGTVLAESEERSSRKESPACLSDSITCGGRSHRSVTSTPYGFSSRRIAR